MAQALVVQHVDFEDAYAIAVALREAGVGVDTCRVDLGQPVPVDASPYAAIVVMGGGMSVASDDGFPTRNAELALLRSALAESVPVMGVCLGAQLLAAAAGGKVYRGDGPEVGWGEITLAPASGDGLFDGLPRTWTVLHWHGDTFTLPPDAVLLASSERYENQAFRVGPTAWGLQFHIEVDAVAVDRFCTGLAKQADRYAVGGAARILERTRGVLDELAPTRTEVVRRFARIVAARAV
jgi:GMP synthase-like glutamine amidotransferase